MKALEIKTIGIPFVVQQNFDNAHSYYASLRMAVDYGYVAITRSG